MKYLKNAPPALIRLHEKGLFVRSKLPGQFVISATWPLLGKLLCDSRMTWAWTTIRKYIKSDEGHEKLRENIISALADARNGSVRVTDKRKLEAITKARKKVYGDIAKTAKALSALIAMPRRLPPDGITPLYTGELDLRAYEFTPEDVASNLGARSFTTMSSGERHFWAACLLKGRAWPRMVEHLDQLAIRARQQGNKNVSSAKRDRGNAYWVIFVRKLYDYFCGVDRMFNSVGFGPIRDITNITMTVEWERQRQDDRRNGITATTKPQPFTAKKVRTIICGASGEKLPIKRSKNITR